MTNKRMFFVLSGLLLVTTGSWVSAQEENLDGLVLCNTLGSQDEIENSLVGPGGSYSGQGDNFTKGKFGNAYVADHTEDLLVRFSSALLPAPAGTVEFWAKLIDFPESMGGGGENPTFVSFSVPNYYPVLRFVGNDGHGGGGLSGTMHNVNTATGGYGSWSYAEILGAGQEADWHHYALVWDSGGIPDAQDHMIAIYLNGELNSGYWYGTEFKERESGIALVANTLNEGSVAIDDLKVWNYPKTDFADRFAAGCIWIAIDVKPGSDPNCFNINGHGVIPVAILGSDDFNVTEAGIDVDSLSFLGSQVRVRGKKGPLCSTEYSNGDNYLDMVCHFEDPESNEEWIEGTTIGTLTGYLTDGTPIKGTDSICIVP